MSQHFATDYERVTIHLYRADGTVHTMDLVSGVEPLVTQIVTRGHDVERWNGGLYVERELIATTARVELSGTIAKPRPVEGSTPEDQLIDEVIADASPGSTPLDSPAPGAVYDVSPAEVERCYLSGEHEPHDYYVDAPAGEWRHCDGAAPAGEVVSPQQLDALGMSELMEMLRTGKTSRDVLVEALGEKVVAATEAAYRAAGEVDTFPDTPGAGWGSSDIASAWTVTKGTGADFTTPPPDMRSRRQGGRGAVAQAGEPALVPPPVDALLETAPLTITRLGYDRFTEAFSRGDHKQALACATDAVWAAGVEEGRRREERESLQVIEERDEARETADRLANAVGRHLGLDVGEHSNMNDPWMVALDALAEANGGKFVKGAYDDGVAEGRRQAANDITEWLRQVEPSAVKYAPESSVCTRQANAAVLGGYERAAAIARDGLRRNTHCSNCGDTRGGPFGHETSECTWDSYRLGDALGVPREATEERTDEQRHDEVRIEMERG